MNIQNKVAQLIKEYKNQIQLQENNLLAYQEERTKAKKNRREAKTEEQETFFDFIIRIEDEKIELSEEKKSILERAKKDFESLLSL